MKKGDNKDKNIEDIILVPTDFSETCGNAISHSVRLAQVFGMKVCILHVINKETKAILKKKDDNVNYIYKRLKEYKSYYEKKYRVSVETLAVEGSIFSVINQVAKDIKARLMILGTHGKKGLQHVFGSYALRVVLDCPVPVIVVQKRTAKKGYHNIVFPISNELEPRQKVQWAGQIARTFDSKIHLFRALESDAGLNSRLTIITHQITTVLDEKKIPYEVIVAEKTGDLANQVIRYSVRQACDLIMIMTRPNADVSGFSFSAWDEKLMFNESQIPVMCINPVNLADYYYDWMM